MRELKFRAWVFYGSKLEKPHYSRDYDSLDRFFEDHDENDIDQCIEQYTGLQDRGVEIYEGDIIRWANSVGREITAPVVWNTRAWCWTAGDYMLGGLLEFDLEVVGNIHEDLKLLEAKQ